MNDPLEKLGRLTAQAVAERQSRPESAHGVAGVRRRMNRSRRMRAAGLLSAVAVVVPAVGLLAWPDVPDVLLRGPGVADGGPAESRPTAPSGDPGRAVVHLRAGEYKTLAAAPTNDPTLKAMVVRDTEGVRAVWRMADTRGTAPSLPPGMAGVVVFARQAQSTCRSTDDVVGVKIVNDRAVVELDPNGEFMQPCPGPPGTAAWTTFVVAFPARYNNPSLDGAGVRLASLQSDSANAAPTRPTSPPGSSEPPPQELFGPRLSLRGLPPLPREGVAVALDDGVVLIGLDGGVHGHIPGRLGVDSFFGFEPTRQGPTNLLRLAPEGPPGDRVWLDPHSGDYLDAWQVAAPLWGSSRVVHVPHAGPQEEMQLDRAGEEGVARWPADSSWSITPDHRLATWLPCSGEEQCDPRFYDSDGGATGELPSGCRAAHALGDFALTLICDNGRSLSLPEDPGTVASERVSVPESEDGHTHRFVAVYDDGIVRVDTPECRASQTYHIRGRQPRPVGPGDISGAPLGVLADGRVVVHHNGDARCGLAASSPGIYVLDPATQQRTLVWAGAAPIGDVQLWAPTGAAVR